MYEEFDLIADSALVLDGTAAAQEVVSPFVHYHINNQQYLDGARASLLAEKIASLQHHRKAINASVLYASNEVTTDIDTWDQQKYTVEILEKQDSVVPLCYRCSDLVHGIGASESTSKDSSMKQLKRDLERDKLSVNGIRVSGSEFGMDGIVKMIEVKIMDILRVGQFPPIEKTVLNALVIQILRKGSRTNSGYLCYENIQQILDETKAMLVPLSTLAKPITISLSIGGLSETPHSGLLCTISCSSFFHVVASVEYPRDETAGQEKIVLVGIYEHTFLLKLNVGGKFSAMDLSSLIGKSSVTIRKHIMSTDIG